MNTPINQLVPKVRNKLANCVADIKRYNDDILTDSIKTVIDMETLGDKKFNHDNSAINPTIAENSEEEQQLILKACLLFSARISPGIIDSLRAELHKSENGEELFSSR